MNQPFGFSLDHGSSRLRVLLHRFTDIGRAGCGVQSIGTRLGAPQSKALQREFRRLTMRGDLLLIVRLARSLAQVSSRLANQRARFRGRSGGEDP